MKQAISLRYIYLTGISSLIFALIYFFGKKNLENENALSFVFLFIITLTSVLSIEKILRFYFLKFPNVLFSYNAAFVSICLFLELYAAIGEAHSHQRVVTNGLITYLSLWVVLIFWGLIALFSKRYYQNIANEFNESSISNTKTENADHIHKDTNNVTFRELQNISDSLLERVRESKILSFVFLIFIVFIVIIGGFFSVGSMAINEYNSIREIKKAKIDFADNLSSLNSRAERRWKDIDSLNGNLLSESDSIKKISLLWADDTISRLTYAIKADIDTLKTAHLEKLLLEAKEIKENYSDIFMRLSIAVLTIFLVQIFFNVYKYFQVQTNFLQNKLEALRLYMDPDLVGEQKNKLREFLLSNMGKSPVFGKDPASPLEHMLKMGDKISEKK